MWASAGLGCHQLTCGLIGYFPIAPNSFLNVLVLVALLAAKSGAVDPKRSKVEISAGKSPPVRMSSYPSYSPKNRQAENFKHPSITALIPPSIANKRVITPYQSAG